MPNFNDLNSRQQTGLGIAGLALGAGVGVAAYLFAKYNPRGGPVGNRDVPEPSKRVDLNRYLGRWYEQYRYEAPFQKGMEAVSADYALKDDGTIRVDNQARRGSVDGPFAESVGKAKVVDSETNAKLKVSFFGPFWGDYWVLDHCDDYRWSIVGEPSGRFLWILTRDRNPAPAMLAMLEGKVKDMGYDWSLIRRTKQPGATLDVARDDGAQREARDGGKTRDTAPAYPGLASVS